MVQRDGSLDTSFQDTELNGRVFDISQQNDSSILAVGSFSNAGKTNRNAIARFKMDGSLDTSFDPGIGPDIANMYCVRAYNNQYVYVGGGFSQFNNATHQGIVRLLSDGTVDNTFNTSATPIYAPSSIEITTGGKILVAESSDRTIRDYNSPLRLYRLMDNGSLDNSFQTPHLGWTLGTKVKEGNNGSVYWLGQIIQEYNPNIFQQTIICLKPDGSLDSSAKRLPSNYIVGDFALLPEGKVLVCGQILSGVDSTNFVMRLKPDLSIDSTFIPVALYYNLKQISFTPEGNIVIAGETKRYLRLNNDQVQNVGLLKNSSLQIKSSDGALTTIVKNIVDSVSLKQAASIGTSSAQNFTAANPSNINVSLLDPHKITITGPNAAEFSASFTNNSSVINKKDSLPFKIIFTPTTVGTKSVTVTIPYSNGIDNKYSFTLVANATDRITAVVDVRADDHNLYLYPNPTSTGKVHIKSKNAIDQFSVVDIIGKQLFSGRFNSPGSENKEILLPGLLPGVYFIKLKGKKTDETVKLMVVK
ncbi:MAG: T9SS type A sorting domain-containing protein [Bacteroidia bacterium]